MKFTSEDLMKAMGLSIGDRIKVTYCYGIETYTVTKQSENILLTNDDLKEDISNILDQDFEILPRPKRVGETLCKGKCETCPLRITRCEYKHDGNETLYDILDCAFDGIEDEEIYDLLKARLDKEVNE